MDQKTAARIKTGARFEPVKDIQKNFAQLLISDDPEKLSLLKQNLMESIDSCALEYKILSRERDIIQNAIGEWSSTGQQYMDDLEALETEINSLDKESQQLLMRQKELKVLGEIQVNIEKINAPAKIEEMKQLQNTIQEIQLSISNVQAENKIRKENILKMFDAFNQFLSPEQFTKNNSSEQISNSETNVQTNLDSRTDLKTE